VKSSEGEGSDPSGVMPGEKKRKGGNAPFPMCLEEINMPRKPKRPCSYPGCPKLVDGQYCEEHKKLTDAQYNKYGRDDFTKSFYKTKEWLFVRKRQLTEHPFCEECLKQGKRTRATMVDHIQPIKQGGQPFAPSNLQSLCWSCHSRKSVEEGSRFARKNR